MTRQRSLQNGAVAIERSIWVLQTGQRGMAGFPGGPGLWSPMTTVTPPGLGQNPPQSLPPDPPPDLSPPDFSPEDFSPDLPSEGFDEASAAAPFLYDSLR